MALFEHVLVLKQELSTADLEAELKNHNDTISELNGTIKYNESWGLRNLAYPINNSKKAFYEFMNIEMPGDNLKTLNSKLNLNENIIRYLSVKVSKFGEIPSLLMNKLKFLFFNFLFFVNKIQFLEK